MKESISLAIIAALVVVGFAVLMIALSQEVMR